MRREQRERAPPGDGGQSPQHAVVVIVILVVIIIIAARDRDLQKSRGERKEETGLIMERKTYLDNQTRKKKQRSFFWRGELAYTLKHRAKQRAREREGCCVRLGCASVGSPLFLVA